MLTEIYLSDKRDSDLIALYYAMGKRDFMKLLKDSLRSAVRPFYVPEVAIPDLSIIKNVEIPKGTVIIMLSISAGKDKDVEEVLKRCKKGRRSFFCREALRFYLGALFVLGSALTSIKPTSKQVIETNIQENDSVKSKPQRRPPMVRRKTIALKEDSEETEEIRQEDIELLSTPVISKDISESNIDDLSSAVKDTDEGVSYHDEGETSSAVFTDETTDSSDDDEVLSMLAGIIG